MSKARVPSEDLVSAAQFTGRLEEPVRSRGPGWPNFRRTGGPLASSPLLCVHRVGQRDVEGVVVLHEGGVLVM